MRLFPGCVALLLAASLLPLQAEAAKKKSPHGQSAQTEASATVQSPADFADAFHEAMRTRNREKILSMLAPDLVLFETGYMQATREEYIKNGLSDDADFASVMDYRPLSRGVIGSGQHMTVLTKASIKGIFGDQRVDLVQSETMILRRTQTSWEIVHLHWSAHPRQPDDSGPNAQPEPPAPASAVKSSTELTAPAVPAAKQDEAKTP